MAVVDLENIAALCLSVEPPWLFLEASRLLYLQRGQARWIRTICYLVVVCLATEALASKVVMNKSVLILPNSNGIEVEAR